jgi:hypothetical protein
MSAMLALQSMGMAVRALSHTITSMLSLYCSFSAGSNVSQRCLSQTPMAAKVTMTQPEHHNEELATEPYRAQRIDRRRKKTTKQVRHAMLANVCLSLIMLANGRTSLQSSFSKASANPHLN